jgi:hypothetical protein
MDMKRRDPRSLAALPDLDAATSARVENGELRVEERKEQQDFREVPTQTQIVERLSLLWESRLFLGCVAVVGLLLSMLIVFLIPNSYESSVRLMPPDNPSNTGLAQAALALAGGTAGLGGNRQRAFGSKEQRPPGRRPRQSHGGRRAHPEV